MTPVRPAVDVPGDGPEKTMWRHGHIVGFDKHKVVWCFGFTPKSPGAEAFGLVMPEPGPLYVLADHAGKIHKEHRGPMETMPDIMADVIE